MFANQASRRLGTVLSHLAGRPAVQGLSTAPTAAEIAESAALRAEIIESSGYFVKDKGRRHLDQKSVVKTLKTRQQVDPTLVASDLEALQRDGYVHIHNLITKEEAAHYVSVCEPLWEREPPGETNFHGFSTQRVQGIPAKTTDLAPLLEHPRILSLIDQVLAPNYLLGNVQAVKTAPGETAQPLHYDAQLYPIHLRGQSPEYTVTVVWSLCDFHKENGATRFVRGSHKWPKDFVPDEVSIEYADVPIGSAIVWLGQTYHSAGGNASNDFRRGVIAAYSDPYIRTLENFSLTPLDMVRKYSPVMQGLLGFSMAPPYVGSVDSRSPLKLLEK